MGKVGKAGINKEFEDQVRTAGPQRARLQWRRPDRRTRMTRDRLWRLDATGGRVGGGAVRCRAPSPWRR
jgi:hypothetical protein